MGVVMHTEVTQLLELAAQFKKEIIAYRRFLHQNPETGFSLPITKKYVKEQLLALGYEPTECGESGLVALAGGKKPGKVFLLRADMDALPIKEEANVDFASTNDNMHACGHDMHTAMLLGAAKILKEYENEIQGTVKLMFQPGEELLLGAKEMLSHGVLKNPSVDAGIMIHIMVGIDLPAGTVIVAPKGVSAPACDNFTIEIAGKGGHGSMPEQTIDPINVACHIHLSLQEIIAREIAMNDQAVLTIGAFHAGNAGNVIPNTATISGTLRAMDEQVRAHIKKRLSDIVDNTAKMFCASAQIIYTGECPTLTNDTQVIKEVHSYLTELLGPSNALSSDSLGAISKSSGSEDFAYISHEIPTAMLALAAGKPGDGYCYGLHHPKVIFDETALLHGSAVYAYTAMRWLEEH